MTFINIKYFAKANLYHTDVLSTQHHSPLYSHQSRDHRQHYLYSVRSTAAHSLSRTTHQYILKLKQNIFFANFQHKLFHIR